MASPSPRLPILAELPAGYTVWEEARGVAAVADEVAEPLRALGVTATAPGRVSRSDLHGRRALVEYRLPDRTLVVRRFHHGGLLRWATGARFRDPERPFRELCVSAALRAAGFRSPKVVGARARLASGGGWYLELWTERVQGAVDLGTKLEAARAGRLPLAQRFALTRSLGALVGRLHAAGIAHADLQPRNLLVDVAECAGPDPPELWVIDLDRTRVRATLTTEQRRKNLRRLFRFVARRNAAGPRFVQLSDYARCMAAYAAEVPGCDWRADWRAVTETHARRSLAHRVGQALERRFSDSSRRLGRESR